MEASQSSSHITPYTTNVLREVAGERQRQDEKWGPVSRPPLEWLGIAAEEFGEVAEKVVKGWVPPESDFDREGYRTELIQLAAVCVSAVECLDYGTAGLGRPYPPPEVDVSRCCNAEVKPTGDAEGTTYYLCCACGEPTDVA